MSTQKQKTAIKRQRAHGNSLRSWLQDRAHAAAKRRAKARETAPTGSRGVDRVPARYQVHGPVPKFVVEHTGEPYKVRRDWARSKGRNLPASSNTPHINPDRDYKRHARLKVLGGRR